MSYSMRLVPGFGTRYYVTDEGRVFSVNKNVWLKPRITDEGYVLYALFNGKRYEGHFAHRLVLRAFEREPYEGEEGCHRDNDPSNNKLSNLKWGTKSENQKQRLEFGTDMRGEKHPRCKLSDNQVAEVKMRLSLKHKGKIIAADLGVSPSLVSLIKRGKHREWVGESA